MLWAKGLWDEYTSDSQDQTMKFSNPMEMMEISHHHHHHHHHHRMWRYGDINPEKLERINGWVA